MKTQIKQLIKDLKKVMKGGSARGGNAHGTYSCITSESIQCSTPEWRSNFKQASVGMLTKIITRKDIYEKELENAQFMDEIFRDDSANLLFPIEACSFPVDDTIRNILQNCKNREEIHRGEQAFDKNANTVYILKIENGGETLEELNKNGALQRYTDKELFDIMDDITASVKHLHSKNISHGDINPLNITIRNNNGHPRAFIIDFGESVKNTRDFLSDARNTIDSIKLIASHIKNDSIRENIRRISPVSTFDKLINTLNELNEDDNEAGFQELLARGPQLVGEPSSPPGSPVRGMQLFNSTPKRLRMSSP